MNAKKLDSDVCPFYLDAVYDKTDCKHNDCKRHLLYDGLGLNPLLIKKTEKYCKCSGCDAYASIEWELPEIAELWGRSKQIIFHWEKQALEKLREVIG